MICSRLLKPLAAMLVLVLVALLTSIGPAHRLAFAVSPSLDEPSQCADPNAPDCPLTPQEVHDWLHGLQCLTAGFDTPDCDADYASAGAPNPGLLSTQAGAGPGDHGASEANAGSLARGPNLLVNGDFSKGLSGWALSC